FFRKSSGAFRLAACRSIADTVAFLVRDFRSRPDALCLGWVRSLPGCPCRLCQCHPARHSLGDVHVHHSRRANLVRLWLGDATARDRVSCDLSLSVTRWSPIPEMPAAAAGDLAFSLARFSHHDWCRPDQTTRRSMLARSDLPVLSLRNAADPESDQPVPAFRTALVPQIRHGLESFYRTGRSLVFLRAAARPPCRRRVAGQFSNRSHHQRQPVVLELRDDRSISRL